MKQISIPHIHLFLLLFQTFDKRSFYAFAFPKKLINFTSLYKDTSVRANYPLPYTNVLNEFIKNSKSETNLLMGTGNRKNQPGSELFPEPGSSYVPSGLSPEEYKKIKEKETNALKKKDFGSWGPRFLKTDAPSGDWFAMPSLWTAGFSTNKEETETDTKTKNGIEKVVAFQKKILHFLSTCRRAAPIFLLSLLFVETLTTTTTLIFFAKQGKIRHSLFSQVFVNFYKNPKHVIHLFNNVLIGMTLVKTILAGLISKPIVQFKERCNRKLLWSPRRFLLVSFSSLGAIFFFTTIQLFKMFPYLNTML